MTKTVERKWKRANRMMDLREGRLSAGRYPAVLRWADRWDPGWCFRAPASLALDGLSVKELP